MLQLSPQSRIFLATEPVDFRKGIDGLGSPKKYRRFDRRERMPPDWKSPPDVRGAPQSGGINPR